MRRPRFRSALLLAGLTAWVLVVCVRQASARQFTDAQGRTIEADVVGASPTHVMLKKGGRTFKVPLEKLSQQDRAYIDELRAEGEKRRKLAEARAALLRPSDEPKKLGGNRDDDNDFVDDGKNDFVDDGKNDFVADDKAKDGDKKPKPAPVGKVTTEKLEAVGDDEPVSYYLYKPTTLKPSELRPVMYVLSPSSHGVKPHFQKYVAGAEQNGFIVIMPIYGHGSETPAEEVDQMVIEKTMEKLPIDKKRVFLSGHSSAADRCYRFSTELGKKAAVGILACDGGTGLSRIEVARDVVVYGTCGTGSRRRYEMAYMFEKLLKGKEHRLRFFLASNTWPTEELLTEGITWLNLCNLASAREAALTGEWQALVQRLLKRASEEREASPVAAYKAAEMVRDTVKDSTQLKTVTAICRELEKNAEVKAYVEGKEAAEKFISRYIADEDPRKRNLKEEDRSAKRAGERLAEEYKDTEWGPLLGRLGEMVL